MNIGHLNAWAGVVAPVAIAILWQSSVLIAVVWVFDSLLGRKLRSAIRYAIWLMVLIKLVLPPGLAFPTGLAWWMRPPVQPVRWHAMPAVTYAVADVGLTPSVAVPAQLPKPTLSLPAALLLVSAGVSGLLAAYLVCRWRRVAQRTAGAQAALDGSLLQLLEEARQAAGVRSPVTLRIVQEVMSPARRRHNAPLNSSDADGGALNRARIF